MNMIMHCLNSRQEVENPSLNASGMDDLFPTHKLTGMYERKKRHYDKKKTDFICKYD